MAAQIFSDWRAIPKEARGATVALGNFDGVHLGHVAVLKAAQAARPELPLAVLTFEPHPREHFRPDDPAFRLTLLPAKAACLADAGANYPPGLLLKAGKPQPRIFHLRLHSPVAPFSPQGSKP